MNKIKSFPKNHLIYLAFDIVITFSVVMLSFFAYYGFHQKLNELVPNLIYCGSITLVTIIAFWIFKIYRIITLNIGIFDCIKIMAIILSVQLTGYIVLVILNLTCLPKLPRFSPFIFIWLLSTASLLFLIPSVRIFVRVFNIASNITKKKNGVRTIVIGAGATGKVMVDESRRNRANHNYVVAMVDDDKHKIGGTFANIPVEGPISNIDKIIKKYNVEEVIIAINNLSRTELHHIFGLLSSCNVRVRRMPLLSEMAGPNDKRIIDVDLDDLLCREPIKLDNSQINEMLGGKTVMVTGAGGSIGSELVRQIFETRPATLILFDIYENSTYDIQQELVRKIRNEKIDNIDLVTLIGSTYNEQRVEQILKKYKPDYIYHAAAYKHVPLMEDSPAEAIRTNVIGTYNVAKLADKYGVKKMVLVSTDKAVRPTNVMGATKRFAETIIQYFADKSKHTRYAAVRFGNVLGSNGSVVPLFKKQIESGGPITITDKKIIRYFMTIPEAVSLILQCGLFAEGGEIFILDMGKPVKILDLAEKLIRQAGLVPNVDIKIVETGLRPGEKLFEELLLDTNHQTKTANSRIYVEEKESIKPIQEEIEKISLVFNMEKTSDVKKLLSSIIDTYQITENK